MLSEPYFGLSKRPGLIVSATPVLFIITTLVAAVAVAGIPLVGELQLSTEVRIEGAVYGERGRVIPNVRVRLESEGGDEIYETGLDDQGRFAFAGLRRAVYNLIATAEGYETVRQAVDLTRSPSHSVIDLVMTPLKKDGTGDAHPSLTDAHAPKKARKEYQKGVEALAANKIPVAKAHFAKAVAEYPCYARAQTAAALGLIADRDLAGAETALKKAIACDPGFTGAYLKLGELYNAEVRFRDSQAVLESGLRLEPGSWKFHYHLGAAYFGMGAYGKAEDEYLRSASLTPPAPADVHVKLADLYSKEKLYGKAYAEMQAYLRAEPNGRFAPKVKIVMQQMESSAAVNPAPVSSAVPTPSAGP